MSDSDEHEHQTTLHKRVGVLEKQMGDVMEWKPTIASSIKDLTSSLKENTDTTKKTLDMVTSVDGVLRGDIGGKSPGLHSDVRELKDFAKNVRGVLNKIYGAIIVAIVGGFLSAAVWIIRHMVP